jgi:hypothetical protein
MQKLTLPLFKGQVDSLIDIIERLSQHEKMRYPSHTYMFMFSEVIIGVYGRLKNKHWKMAGNDVYSLKINRGEAAALWELCKACKDQEVRQRILIIDIMARIDKKFHIAALEEEQKAQPHV